MLRLLLVCLLIFFVGCTSMPGSIRESVSGFDKTTEIVMEPAGVFRNYNESYIIYLGLYKTSKMEEDNAVMEAFVRGAYSFADKESVQFNIGGEVVTLESLDSLTNIETKEGDEYFSAYNESSKRYTVNKDLINKLINGNTVWIKINLSRGEYVEGEFSKDSLFSAKQGFIKFYDKVWGKLKGSGG